MSYAKRGMQAMNERVAVGFTNLNPVLNEMKQTDATARIFNDDVRANVVDGDFKTAWNTWYADWREFFEGRFNSRTNTDIFSTDKIAERAANYRQDLARFQVTYQGMTTADGKRLPSNAPVIQVTPLPNDPNVKQDGIPLWALLLGVGAIGAGVFIYWRLKKTGQMLDHRRQILEKEVVPLVFSESLGPSLGPAFAKAATAHDLPAAAPSCGCQRDLDVIPVPRAASKYFLSRS
jgi:hypothetical protein